MLMLRRRKNEILVFTVKGVQFEVKVSNIRGGQITLTLDLPAEVNVRRKEVSNDPTRVLG